MASIDAKPFKTRDGFPMSNGIPNGHTLKSWTMNWAINVENKNV